MIATTMLDKSNSIWYNPIIKCNEIPVLNGRACKKIYRNE